MNELTGPNFDPKEAEARIFTLLDLNKWWSVNIWVKGSREFLDRVLDCLDRDKFSINHYNSSDIWDCPLNPEEVWEQWYISVVDSTWWTEGSYIMDKTTKSYSSEELGISKEQNSVFITWSSDSKYTFAWWKGLRDAFFSESHE